MGLIVQTKALDISRGFSCLTILVSPFGRQVPFRLVLRRPKCGWRTFRTSGQAQGRRVIHFLLKRRWYQDGASPTRRRVAKSTSDVGHWPPLRLAGRYRKRVRPQNSFTMQAQFAYDAAVNPSTTTSGTMTRIPVDTSRAIRSAWTAALTLMHTLMETP
jgi:hypothetical protein